MTDARRLIEELTLWGKLATAERTRNLCALAAARITELEAECLSRGKEAEENRRIYMAEIKALRAGLEDKIGVDELNRQLIQLDKAMARIAELEAQVAELGKGESREWVKSTQLDELQARIAELEAAVDEIARQRTLAEDEAHWCSEREGEEWSPDVETGYDALIDIARRVSRASPAPAHKLKAEKT